MSKLRVGVTGINAVDNPGPGIGVIRSLKEDPTLEVDAVGLAYDAMDPGIYMEWLVDRSYLMPYPSGREEDYLARLYYIKNREALDLVIPTLDAELPVFINAAPEMERWGLRTFLPSKAQFALRAKNRLPEVAEKIGLRCPETAAVSTYAELAGALERLGYPVMVKGLYYKAIQADDYARAAAAFDAVAAEWGYPVIVQKVITGDELNVIGLGDGQGGTLGLVGIKKLWITTLGKIWTGVTVKHEEMLGAAERFVETFKWRGAFELECILSGGEIHLIEINPRFPAWVYFATGVGVNLPARLVRAATGLAVERDGNYEAGRLYVRYTYDIVTDMKAFRSMALRAEFP